MYVHDDDDYDVWKRTREWRQTVTSPSGSVTNDPKYLALGA